MENIHQWSMPPGGAMGVRRRRRRMLHVLSMLLSILHWFWFLLLRWYKGDMTWLVLSKLCPCRLWVDSGSFIPYSPTTEMCPNISRPVASEPEPITTSNSLITFSPYMVFHACHYIRLICPVQNRCTCSKHHTHTHPHIYRDIKYHFLTTLGPLRGGEAELIELSW